MAILLLRAIFHDDGGGGRSQAQLYRFLVAGRVFHESIERFFVAGVGVAAALASWFF